MRLRAFRGMALALPLMLAAAVASAAEPGVDPAPDLALATSALESGDAGQAKLLFQRILEAQPGSLDAHLGLGRAYLALGEYARARMEFETVLYLDDLPPDLHSQAEVYAEAARQHLAGERLATHAHVQAGVGRYSPDHAPDENFGTLRAGGDLSYRFSDAWSLNASVEARFRSDELAGSSNAFRGRVGLNRSHGNSQTHFEVTSRRRRDVSGFHFIDHAASVQWRHHPDADNQISLGGRVSQVNIPDGAVGQLNRNLRAAEFSAGLEHSLRDGDASIAVNALLGREWARRGGIDGDADFHGLGAEYQTALGERVGFWVGGSWRHNGFSLYRPVGDSPDPVRRSENLYELFAGLAWRLPHGWELLPEVLVLRDRGNIAANHYDSTEFSVSLRRDF